MPEPVQARDRAQVFEPVPVQVFDLASAQVLVPASGLARERARERELVSGLALGSVSELVREQASELELGRVQVEALQPVLWERCPYLCLSRWQRCRLVPARRQ